MSVNITVNGKFGKTGCKKNALLDQDERLKKEKFDQRRLQRIQQVREESKNLARKIRNDVAQEKNRQLNKLEQLRNKELNCWRESVIHHKYHDYRSAIFQVGVAHRAAKEENERKMLKQEQLKEQHRKNRDKRRAIQKNGTTKCCNDENLKNITNVTKPEKSATSVQKSSNQVEDVRQEKSTERKRKTYDETDSDDDDDSFTTSSLHLDEETDSDDTLKTTNTSKTRTTDNLQKTPAVILDVELDSDESLIVSTQGAIEIRDKFAENNRQFSRVVSPSAYSAPAKVTSLRIPVKSIPSTRFTQISDLVNKKTKNVSPTKSPRRSPRKSHAESPRKDEPQIPVDSSKNKLLSTSPKRQSETSAKSVTKEATSIQSAQSFAKNVGPKRSSLKKPAQTQAAKKSGPVSLQKTRASTQQKTRTQSISKLQSQTDGSGQSQAEHTPLPPITVSLPPAPPPSLHNLSEKTLSKPTQSTTNSGSAIVPVSRSTISAGNTDTTSIPRVESYDYNNKFTKGYTQSGNMVQANINDPTQLNANHCAEIEKNLQKLRELEAEKIRKNTEARGQKALEREQVRRDYVELTEKLDALSRQNSQLLPNDANFVASHRFEEVAVRRVTKMNNAVEKIMLRPAIITCPEVQPQPTTSRAVPPTRRMPQSLNVGESRPGNGYHALASDDKINISSDSCCTVLLDYVDDQSKRLRSQITQTSSATNPEKKEKLKNLLDRIQVIREKLLRELKSGDNAGMSDENMQNILESMHNEQENVFSADDGCSGNDRAKLAARESELKQKEEILDKRLKEFYELQKQTKESEPPSKLQQKKEEELEIIIKVRSDGRVVKCVKKPKHDKTPICTSSSESEQPAPSSTPKIKQTDQQARLLPERQNSYDSNSTSYRSLPPALNNDANFFKQQMKNAAAARKAEVTKGEVPEDEFSSISSTSDQHQRQAAQPILTKKQTINPLIAQYIQNLLGMTRYSIDSLGVSSSDVATPSSSIMNTTGNISTSKKNDEQFADMERMKSIQTFIDENRSFVQDLEGKLRAHEQTKLEENSQNYKELWTQKLNNGQQKDRQGKVVESKSTTVSNSVTAKRSVKIIEQQPTQPSNNIANGTSKKDMQKNLMAPAKRVLQTTNHEVVLERQETKTQSTTSEITTSESQRALPVAEKQVPTVAKPTDLCPRTQFERFAILTENCTHRIAELTQLIDKVRTERQQIMEETYGSISDGIGGGRNSTEYLELPAATTGTRTSSEQSTSTNLPLEPATTSLPLPENVPLEKHKAIGYSIDSGIAGSRPMTALDQNYDMEPMSISSTTTPKTSTQQHQQQQQQQQQQRKTRPPPTLHRFSPLMCEEEVAHELSTIVEVETPGTSHINATNRANSTATNRAGSRTQPITFPTFEQYANELHLDLSQINPEQSIMLENEFNDLLKAIESSSGGNIADYEKFPSIAAYLQNMTAPQFSFNGRSVNDVNSSQSINGLVERLRIANVSIRKFPTQREYMAKAMANQSANECELIDSASLENMTEQCTNSSGADSLNIEAELRQRKILRKSFQRMNSEHQCGHVATSTQRDSVAFYAGILANETGIEKMSTSHSDTLSGEMEREMQKMGLHWPTTMRLKQQEAAALSSTTTSSASLRNQKSQQPVARQQHLTNSARHSNKSTKNANDESGDIGQSLNLRDFLTRELLKHKNKSNCSGSSSQSLSDSESLKSNFLHTLIDSIAAGTPRTNNAGGTGITLDRQKTSTPVVSAHSSQSRSNATTPQMFSGESRLSSVHFKDNISICYNEKRAKVQKRIDNEEANVDDDNDVGEDKSNAR